MVGEAPVVDTTSNEVGSNYDREWVDNAPLRRFSFFDLVAAAPGSLQGGDSNNTSRTMVYGSSYDENSFQVDGVDITDNYFNEALAEPNTDAIEEVEVLSLGAPAEYGNLTGAVYNIVTRQGTNEFHGDARLLLPVRRPHRQQHGGHREPGRHFLDALPGRRRPLPVDPRQLHRLQRSSSAGPSSRTSSGSSPPTATSATTTGTWGWTTRNDLTAVRGRTDRYFGKLNWQINPKHKLVGTFHLDDKEDDGGLAVNSAPETAITRSGQDAHARRSAIRACSPTGRCWRSATRASTAT